MSLRAETARGLRSYPLALILFFVTSAVAAQPDWQASVDRWVLHRVQGGATTEFLVVLKSQADLRQAVLLDSKTARGWYVYETLAALADRTQGPVREELERLGVPHVSYWIANMIWVRADRSVVEAMARRTDVARIEANPRVRLERPGRESSNLAPAASIERGVLSTEAPQVFWNAGFFGQGAVIGGQDTGYDWDHPALIGSYRGWDGTTADHNYNWHDAIHSGGGICGADSQEPCDDSQHGTHTMGTMSGFDGGDNWVGMAPAARWMGCRNMNQGIGTPTTYSECFQWFVAPTDLNGQNPDPSMAPHVINNSWSCPPSEGCTDINVMKTVVENVRAAGILVVVSAGNSGSDCGSVSTPAAIYDASFSVGATDSFDNIAGFSSRGPVTVDGSQRLKPDISAPGVGVRSSIPGGGYSSFSGTSMAGPHVAGMAALVTSAAPCWAGNPEQLEQHLRDAALGRTTAQSCGGVPGSQVPNNTYGYGALRSMLPGEVCAGLLTLTVGEVVSGQTVELTVSGARSGEEVLFFASVTGPGLGPCSQSLGACLDIRLPVRPLGSGIANGLGVATLEVDVRAGLSGRVFLQAVIEREGQAVKSGLAVPLVSQSGR